MNDKDQEVLNRFHLYSQRFLQYSVAEEVYLDTLAYIKQLIEERDEAKREVADAYSKKTMNGVIVKTLNAVVTDGGKAVPPKYEDLDNA
jgi:hypothetical protein